MSRATRKKSHKEELDNAKHIRTSYMGKHTERAAIMKAAMDGDLRAFNRLLGRVKINDALYRTLVGGSICSGHPKIFSSLIGMQDQHPYRLGFTPRHIFYLCWNIGGCII